MNHIYDSGIDSKPFLFTYEHIYDSGNDSKHFTFRINDTYDSGNDSKPFHFSYQRHLRFRKRFKAISLYL
ncbi:hypothetical protein L596_015013 [Steinernema carpocapsae]|uniref:Uncharacterized protein n=1 Tax=Steinernema carpocapsae TaxID=34508 RepID=A0A4V6A305_STECR|nr:hypothetical protein L596_015013 [Steinernema carpocapsae]